MLNDNHQVLFFDGVVVVVVLRHSARLDVETELQIVRFTRLGILRIDQDVREVRVLGLGERVAEDFFFRRLRLAVIVEPK